MDWYDWVSEYRWRAESDGHEDRYRLSILFEQASAVRYKNITHALQLLHEGVQLAEQLAEPWWRLYYQNAVVNYRLHYQDDYRDLADLALKNLLEVRKPIYAQYPERWAVYHAFLSALVEIDPSGYAEPIEQTLQYLMEEAGHDLDEHIFVLDMRGRVAYQLEEWQQAWDWCEQTDSLVAGSSDRRWQRFMGVSRHTRRCKLGFWLGDWATLQESAMEAEQDARDLNLSWQLAELHMWQALLAQRHGDEGRARQMWRLATARMNQLSIQPYEGYFLAAIAYHECKGDLVTALQVRNRELSNLAGLGQHVCEFRYRKDQLRLMRLLGQPLDAELQAARELCQRFRQPAPYLAALNRIVG